MAVPQSAAAARSDRPPALTKRQAHLNVRDVVTGVHDARRYRRSCGRRNRWSFVCRVSWRVRGGSRRGVVVLWRTGSARDHADHYRTRIRRRQSRASCRRSCRSTARELGVLFEEYRRATLGEDLVLHGADGARLRVATPAALWDPLPFASYNPPDAGKRYVGVELSIENTGRRTYRGHFANGGRLVLRDGSAAEIAITEHPACDERAVRIARRQTRRVCLAFHVPRKLPIRRFELRLDSGLGPETGRWKVNG